MQVENKENNKTSTDIFPQLVFSAQNNSNYKIGL